MTHTALLINEYRGGILECEHHGIVVSVNENGVVGHTGDANWHCYYRSASKCIQALCAFEMGLIDKYGLSDEEAAIFSASHSAEPFHVRALEGVLAKTGLCEDDLIMLPTWPGNMAERQRLWQEGKPARRIYHCCSGKHLCMMLVAREMGVPMSDYWKADSPVQKRILRVISHLTDVPEEEIGIGVDGCGVPVYNVPISAIARSFMRFANPELISDEKIAEAAARNYAVIHAAPQMIEGTNSVSSLICAEPSLVGKGGAQGVFAFGVKGEKLGFAAKVIDGSDLPLPLIVQRILELSGMTHLGCYSKILALKAGEIKNTLGHVVGRKEAVFTL